MAPWWLSAQKDEQIEASPEDLDEATIDQASGDATDSQAADREAEDRGRAGRSAASSEGPTTSKPRSPKKPNPQAADTEAAKPADGEVKRKRRRRRRRSTGGGDEASRQPQQGDSASSSAKESAVKAPQAVTAPKPASEPAMSPAAPSTPQASYRTAPMASDPGSPADRNFVFSFPERSTAEERKLALFCDFENIALGVRDSEIPKLDINLILARLVEKGKIIVKKAYADWERYNEYKRPLHEAAIELIDIPQKYYSGKNSADIKLVVDAMDLCYSKEHLDTFVILSGDSDFSPLVSKLKENDKVVIGIGVKNSSSNLLVENCDEFIFYEDIWRAAQKRPTLDNLPPQKAEVFGLMADAMLALLRENKEILWGSLVKQTMQRKRPAFNEEYYGYGSFSELLEDAAHHKVIRLRKDQRSGNLMVTGFAN